MGNPGFPIIAVAVAAVVVLAVASRGFRFWMRKSDDPSLDLDLFLELTTDYFCIADERGNFIRFSSSWTDSLGYPEAEMRRTSILDLVHPDDLTATLDAARSIRKGERIRDFAHRLRKSNGDYLWFSWNASGSGGRGIYIGVARDLNAQMETVKKLEEAREEAERANRAKSQFISTISHELRTPLNAMLGYAALMEDLSGDEKASAYLRSIRGAGNALRDLISDILDLSRAESNKLHLSPHPMDPRNLLAELAEIFRFDVESKGISLSLEAAEGMPSNLLLDSVRLKQVLLNLTGNAVKFTSDGVVSVSFDCRKESGRTVEDFRESYKALILIRVADSGIGMTEEYRSRLFEPFSQQDPSISRSYGGTGLGLSIAKRLLDLMGARISCKSVEGMGTVFDIEIPEVAAAGSEKAFSLWIS